MKKPMAGVRKGLHNLDGLPSWFVILFLAWEIGHFGIGGSVKGGMSFHDNPFGVTLRDVSKIPIFQFKGRKPLSPFGFYDEHDLVVPHVFKRG